MKVVLFRLFEKNAISFENFEVRKVAARSCVAKSAYTLQLRIGEASTRVTVIPIVQKSEGLVALLFLRNDRDNTYIYSHQIRAEFDERRDTRHRFRRTSVHCRFCFTTPVAASSVSIRLVIYHYCFQCYSRYYS